MTENITYYHSVPTEISREPVAIGETIMNTIEQMLSPIRWPVRNREERLEISNHKRALIYARDGMECHICGQGNAYVLDHIIPRSAFRVEELRIADRSDNLACACWDCNERKSNYRRDHKKRLGVVQRCGDCVRGYGDAADPERWEEENSSCWEHYGISPESVVRVYCRTCGFMGRVPGLEWVQ